MAYDAHKNFAYSTITGGTALGNTSAGTLIVQPGDGAVFPTSPYNVVVWPAGQQPLASNAEVMRVTALSTDTFTLTRAQEGSTAKVFGLGDQIAAAITVKNLTDIEAVAQAAFDAASAISDGNPPPSSPAATVRPGVGDLVVSWSEIINADPVYYDLYISTSSGFTPGPTTKVGTERGTLASLRYDATGAQLVPGTTYYVRIIARDADGSAAAGTQGSGTPDPNPFDTDGFPPSSSPTPALVGGPGFITASWTAITNPDPVTYNVYISTTNGFTPGPSTLAAATPATELVISNLHDGTPLVVGTTYYIRVAAQDADGAAAAGSQVSGTTGQVISSDVATDGILPATPTAPTIFSGIGFLTAAWTPVTNQSDPVKYRVYVDTSSGFTPGTGNLYATTSANSIVINKTGGPTPVALTYGQTYFVKIIAFDNDGSSGASLGGSGAPVQVSNPDIAANAVTAGTIAAGAVTAAKINVSQLSAISSDVGTLTAGTIDASGVNVTNLNASNITSGTLAAGRIAAGSLNASVIGAGTIDASVIDVINLDATNIVTGTLDADLISVINLDAGSIVSGTIEASEVSIHAVGVGGQEVDIGAAGISLLDAGGAVLVSLPTDGSSATFSGTVVTDDLTVQGGLTIQGITNVMDKGSQLILNAQLSSPSTAPQLAFEYDVDAMNMPGITGITYTAGVDYTTTGGTGGTSTVYYELIAIAGTIWLYEFDVATNNEIRHTSVVSDNGINWPIGCAQIGSLIHVVIYNINTASFTSRQYNISDFSLNTTTTITSNWTGLKQPHLGGRGMGVGTDGTYLMLLDWVAGANFGSAMKIARLDPAAGLALHDQFNLSGGITFDGYMELHGVTGRKSGEHCILVLDQSTSPQLVSTFQLYDATTHSKITSDGNTWSPDSVTSAGNSTIKPWGAVTYGGGQYHSIRRLHAEVVHYSNWVWTAGTNGNTFYVGYQWYDSVSTSHTKLSPMASVRLDGTNSTIGRSGRSTDVAMRGQLRVISPSLPSGATTTQVYELLATAPVNTSLQLQSPAFFSAGTGTYTQYLQSYDTAGAVYVDSNTFGSGTSDIMSTVGALTAAWQIGGDGTFVLPRLTSRLIGVQKAQIEWNETLGGLEVYDGSGYVGVNPVLRNVTFDIPSVSAQSQTSVNVSISGLRVGDLCFWIGTDTGSALKFNTNPICSTAGQITLFAYNVDTAGHALAGHQHTFLILRQG